MSIPIKLLYGDENNLPVINDGNLLFTNEGNIYFDYPKKGRIPMQPSYILTHPDGANGTIIPFLSNDFAHLLARGGIIKVYRVDSAWIDENGSGNVDNFLSTYNFADSTSSYVEKDISIKDSSKLFSGDLSFASILTTESQNVIVIDIVAPKPLKYSTQFYLDFTTKGWGCNTVSWYASSTLSPDSSISYSPLGDYDILMLQSKTILTDGFVKTKASLGVTGANRFRIVLRNPARTTIRIAEIGAINYLSDGINNISISRGGCDGIYGDLLPFKDGDINLGSSAKAWKNIYSETIVSSNVNLIDAETNLIYNLKISNGKLIVEEAE